MDLLLALQATNSKVATLRSSTLEATARGAASVAGLEIGLWTSLDDLAAAWHATSRFEPTDSVVVDAGYLAWSHAVERA
jgi:glycerol kinase